MSAFSRYLSVVRSVLARSAAFAWSRRRALRAGALVGACVFLAAAGAYWAAVAPPTDFPRGNVLEIERGMSASDIAEELAEARVIAHSSVFMFLLRLLGESSSVQAGAYLFNTPEDALAVARRLASGSYGLPLVRLTFFEGETARDMAARVHGAFPSIQEDEFLAAARPYEGYLFPDTYFFSPSSDADSIIKAARANFDAKLAPLAGEIQASGRSFSDIVILASLIEREARKDATKRIIAGILANRLKLDMPLQVDAVFGYIYDRDTYSPSLSDLRVDSPYNTYIHKGLPPGPISNPGLASLEAVLHPTETEYLYYLTGNDGLMHYATTYAGHQANQRKYLN